MLYGLPGGQLLLDGLDSDSRPGDDRLAHHDLRIAGDERLRHDTLSVLGRRKRTARYMKSTKGVVPNVAVGTKHTA